MENLSVIKVIIVSRNMNLLQASEYTGLSQSFISEVINGKRNMKKETLISFLEKMEYTYEQYENLEEYAEELRKTRMKDTNQWSRLLLRTLSFLLEDEEKKQNEPHKQKCIGGK